MHRKNDKGNLYSQEHEIEKIINLLNKVGIEINKISPYFKSEIFKLTFSALHNSINDFYTGTALGMENQLIKDNILFNDAIVEKLIFWFINFMEEQGDNFSPEIKEKFWNLEMVKDNFTLTYYIIKLSRLIDPLQVEDREIEDKNKL